MVMRRRLAHNGVVFVAVDARGRVDVAAMGVPLDEDYAAFVGEACADVAEALGKLKGQAGRDRDARVEAARLAARRAATRWSGKKPQVQVLLLGE
jgi:ribonuclease J